MWVECNFFQISWENKENILRFGPEPEPDLNRACSNK